MHSVGIVILAAGASTRIGFPKQLLPLGGRSLLRRAAETALASDGAFLLVVLGANARQLRSEMAGLDVTVVENPDWAEGMGSSLRVGLAALQVRHPEADAVLFLVCDQPLVSTALLNQILGVYQQSAPSMVASAYGGGLGVPALFSRSLFPELASLESGSGARQILAAHRSEVTSVPFAEGVVDVDTLEDYQRLLEIWKDKSLLPVAI